MPERSIDEIFEFLPALELSICEDIGDQRARSTRGVVRRHKPSNWCQNRLSAASGVLEHIEAGAAERSVIERAPDVALTCSRRRARH